MARAVVFVCLLALNVGIWVFATPVAWEGVNSVVGALSIYGLTHIEYLMCLAIAATIHRTCEIDAQTRLIRAFTPKNTP